MGMVVFLLSYATAYAETLTIAHVSEAAGYGSAVRACGLAGSQPACVLEPSQLCPACVVIL